MSADLVELTNTLAGWMLFLGGKAESPEAGARLSDGLLADGSAWRRFLKMVQLQSGTPEEAVRALEDPARFHKPAAARTMKAESSGYLTITDCTEIGWAVQRLGAGRTSPGDTVSAHAGIEMHAKHGDAVAAGQPLATLYSEEATLLEEPASMLRATLQVRATPPEKRALVLEVIRK